MRIAPLDIPAVETATGWRIEHRPVATSTHDVAALLARGGATPPLAVVADEQTHGRGREGRRFHSPPGGLYVSMLVAVPPGLDPAPIVAASAVAAAEALEDLGASDVRIKWPNDLRFGERKVAGILLERPDGGAHALIGIGMNLDRVPADLPADVAARTVSVADGIGRVPGRTEVLLALLPRIDRRLAEARDPARHALLEAAWRRRQALLGREVVFRRAGRIERGVLEDVSFSRGLLMRDARGPVWLQAAHVVDVASS